jgi:hypothetical protein
MAWDATDRRLDGWGECVLACIGRSTPQPGAHIGKVIIISRFPGEERHPVGWEDTYKAIIAAVQPSCPVDKYPNLFPLPYKQGRMYGARVVGYPLVVMTWRWPVDAKTEPKHGSWHDGGGSAVALREWLGLRTAVETAVTQGRSKTPVRIWMSDEPSLHLHNFSSLPSSRRVHPAGWLSIARGSDQYDPRDVSGSGTYHVSVWTCMISS